MDSSVIENKTASIWLENPVVRVKIKPGAEVRLEDAEEHIAAVEGLCAGRRLPLLTDIRAVRSTSREARLAYGGERSERLLCALAILVESPISRAIGNFFIGLNRPSLPTKIFTSEQAALGWLKEHELLPL
jgi:hypothetical protein